MHIYKGSTKMWSDKEACAAMQALQQREESVRNGKLTTIIFIRDKNAKGQEVSGYIDYGHRQVPLAVLLVCTVIALHKASPV